MIWLMVMTLAEYYTLLHSVLISFYVTIDSSFPLSDYMYLLLSLSLSIVFLVIATLSVQNATIVAVQYLGWQLVPVPVGIVLVCSLAIGMLLMTFLPLWFSQRHVSYNTEPDQNQDVRASKLNEAGFMDGQ